MHLCTCVREEGGNGEGAGEGGDTQVVVGRAESTESVSFVFRIADRKEGEPRNVTHRSTNVNSDTVSASLYRSLHCCGRRPGISDGTSIQSRPRTSESLYFTTSCTRR